MYEEMSIISDAFRDNRKVKSLDENLHLYEAEDGSIIYLDLQTQDFDTEELLQCVEIAETLYEEHHKKIYVYIICPQPFKILVKEFPIKSDANFTIKLAQCNGLNPYSMVLDVIKKKISQNIPLDSEDMEALEILPMVCPSSEKHIIRKEVFDIMNSI